MNRTQYFNYIEEKLNFLAFRINSRSKINLLDLNIHSETFFADLCNIIFNLKLVNLNAYTQNTEGIDLVDNTNKIVIQVSSTCTKKKIEDSLSKSILKEYKDYGYKFISIAKEVSSGLKNNIFSNPHNMNFNPLEDIWDCQSLLRKILSESIEKQRDLYDFIKEELGAEVDIFKVDTNLARIINILAREKLDMNTTSPEVNPFAIEDKIDFNTLKGLKDIIDEYKIFYSKLDEKYSEFDKEGKNKSFSVLQEIRKHYIKLKSTGKNSEEIFYGIVDNIINIIRQSSNYAEIPFEELGICVDILVVDAFVRCKIFENPEGYNHVITR